ncbi:BT_3928 family protein [Formosa sp. A9]|uniref:BT_3928 family protein n=1 Tax=Formosa sp. A9 TaxID=3442641 RepID=UPI003EBABF2C
MKAIVNVSRIFVGILFIISGLIKLNDPIGFSFKLEEYFSAAVLNLTFLEPYALMISVLVVVFEVLLGVFLLIGYKPKFTVWSLLLMIVFFTFLTFYSAYFNKVTDCGCFGDAVKLTPWESFSKDVVLLILIVILFFGVKHIKPVFSRFGLTLVSLFSFIGCLWLAYHVLMHLPVKDFRPYKIGDNLWENMIVPEDAPKADIDYKWTFKVNGEEQVITTKGAYPSVAGEFVSVDTEVIKPGYEAPIHDFTIEKDGEDFTEAILHDKHVVLLIAYNLNTSESLGLQALKNVSDKALGNGYKVIGLTASGEDVQAQVKAMYGYDFDFYFTDETALKTIVRANPGILILNEGTVLQKVHWNDVDDLDLHKVN